MLGAASRLCTMRAMTVSPKRSHRTKTASLMPQPRTHSPAGSAGPKARGVLLISSLVVRGRVGLRAQAFAMERLGFEPWLVPTITLPFHPGHGTATRIEPTISQFKSLLSDLEAKTELGEIAAIVTGYLPDAAFAGPIAEMINAVRAKNPDARVIVDPVIGDDAGLYVPEDTAQAIRDTLLPLADLATPNRFELAWLSGAELADNRACIIAAQRLGTAMVLVTSAHPMMRNAAANLLVHDGLAILAETPAIPSVPHGPGDLTAALMTANLLRGFPPDQALNKTTGAVHEVLAASDKLGTDELALVTAQPYLDRPPTPVAMRQLAGQSGTSRARGRLTPSSLT